MPISASEQPPVMAHRFRSALGEHLLVVPFSRIFDVPAADAKALDEDPAALGRNASIRLPKPRRARPRWI